MAVNLSPIGGVAGQFFDNNGNPLSGGRILTYAAGTTTPQTTYTSANGATPHSNPIILDAAGRVPGGEIWLTDGLQYKFILQTSTSVQIGSYDNIIGINSNFVNYTNAQEIQTATAGQTVFTLTTMQYQPGTRSLSVFVDGVNQYGPGSLYAYQETSDTVVTFTSGLHVGADVKFTTSAINASSYGDAQQISYTPPFTGSVATNVEAKLAQTVSVKDFGAVGDGTADDTTAVQAAIDSSATGFLSVYFPTGTYKITSQITISDDRVMLYGDGSASRILFNPTANAVCFLFDKGSTSSVQNTIRDLTFYSTDTTYTKTAIKLVNVSQCLVENVHTIFPHWFGNGSIFLHILGRDSTGIRGLNVFADKPIRVSPIPAPHVAAGIGIDHFHFSDCYIGNVTSSNPLITFDDAVIISDVTFDGYQAWVGGSYGFYWDAPTSTQSSLNLSFNNVRWEQQLSGGYLAYVNPANDMVDVSFTNCYSGDNSVAAKGYYLRNIKQFAFRSVFYTGASVGLDANTTCTSGELDLVLNSPSSTLSLTATRLTGTIRQGGNVLNYAPNAPSGSGVTQIWNPSKTLGFNQLEPATFTVNASSTVTFSESSLRGLVFIYAVNRTVSAVMAVNGTAGSTKLLSQSDAGWFGTTVGAANINLYWDAPSTTYKLQVNIAFTTTFKIVTMGVGER